MTTSSTNGRRGRTRLERIIEWLELHETEIELVERAIIVIDIHGQRIIPKVTRHDAQLPP